MNTQFWVNKIMDTMYTSNAQDEFWIGLSNTMPSSVDGSGVSEPSTDGTGYARQKITTFSPPDAGVVKNTEAIVFPMSLTTWFPSEKKASYWVLFDGDTSAAHVISAGALNEQKTIESDTQITIAAESLSIALTDYMSESGTV